MEFPVPAVVARQVLLMTVLNADGVNLVFSSVALLQAIRLRGGDQTLSLS